MANIITDEDIFRILDRGCHHGNHQGLCKDCRMDVRAWVRQKAILYGFGSFTAPSCYESCQCSNCRLRREDGYGWGI